MVSFLFSCYSYESHDPHTVASFRRGKNLVEDKTVTNKLLLETLTRLRTEQAEHATTAQKAYQLDDACKAREKQVQSANLVTKFKESALLAYRKGNTSSAFESEKAALREEVSQLKRQLDFHPGNYIL